MKNRFPRLTLDEQFIDDPGPKDPTESDDSGDARKDQQETPNGELAGMILPCGPHSGENESRFRNGISELGRHRKHCGMDRQKEGGSNAERVSPIAAKPRVGQL